jgi:glycosyltransferase involved in cell wall biosynthesis
LRKLSDQLDLKQVVSFEGAVAENAEVRRAFFEANVFCLASRQEGFGIVFLEAMAAGLPVVAARAGAVPEVVADGRTGLLVPAGDERAFAQALLRLLQDRPMAERLGGEGSRRVKSFDLEPVGRAFLAAAGFSQ